MAEVAVKEAIRAIPTFFRMQFPHAWFDYDAEADVLYISFAKPQQATDSELLPDDIVVRRRGKKVVGLTVLRASRFRS